MSLTLFARRPAPELPAPEPWPEIGETWKPEGVTVVERYANQAGAVVLVFSPDDQSYQHVVACLGCHYSQTTDPDKTYSSGFTLTEAGRFANTHAASCRALPRDIPARPDDAAAREQLRKWVASWRRRDRDEEIYLRFFNHGRLVLQRSNEWITSELQRLADAQPDLVRAEPSSYSDRIDYYVRQLPKE
ncbi:hypothetical protein [Streptomyces sp. NPDC048106]|uniref:hypothetical protein n=1 Tax=Streptomyces sp. NPDC048106 TaxID=3155750 RepID=UPI0034533604